MSKTKRSFKQTSKDLRRSPRFVASNKILLIVTEGEKTELNYFQAVRNRLKLSSANVVIIHPEGTDAITLTQDAIRRRKQRKKKNPEQPYDEVWVVYDLEREHDERRRQAINARNLKGAKGVQFAESDPSFEFWLLLHETRTTRSLASSAEAECALKKARPNYAKGEIPSSATLDKIPVAVENAEWVRADNERSGRTNPSTQVDLLIRAMNDATSPANKFLLGKVR